jgi:hypothetical protein
VELALSHDLIQHEKMMAGARTLLSSLSDAQESLARRLDEWMLHDMDTLYMIESLGDDSAEEASSSSSLETVMRATDKLQNVFCSLALELYRKQLLIQSLLDAVNDDLLVRNDDEEEEMDVGTNVNPRRVAEKCLREWPRGSKESHVDVKVLDELLELG